MQIHPFQKTAGCLRGDVQWRSADDEACLGIIHLGDTDSHWL